jgi:melibiase-like protein
MCNNTYTLQVGSIASLEELLGGLVSSPPAPPRAGLARRPGDQRELCVRYVRWLYRVWGTLCERYPQVVWQSCASGGGWADLDILRFAGRIWIRDTTIPTGDYTAARSRML